jgi:hypothetical protein
VCGLLSGRGTPEVFAVVMGCSEWGLPREGGVIARRGPGMCGARVLEGRGCPGAPRWACRPCGHVRARRCSTMAEVV